MRITQWTAFTGLLLAGVVSTNLRASAQEPGTNEGRARPARGTTTGAPGRGTAARGLPFPSDVLPAQLQAVLYEVDLPTNHAVAPDAASLAKQAATTESLLKALSATGKARMLYRLDQPVNVFSGRITIGSSEPVTINSRTDDSGHTVNSVSLANIGTIFQWSAEAPSAETKRTNPDVKLTLQLAGLPSIGQRTLPVRLERVAPFEFDHPELLVSEVSKSSDGEGRPAFYVVRYGFGKPATVASGKPAGLPKEAGKLPAQFEAAVYEVQASAEQLDKLDARKLAREAASADDLLATLRGVGKAQVVFRADQPVNVFSDQVQNIVNTPTVSATAMSGDQPINSITYRREGLSVNLSAQMPSKESKRESPDVMVSAQVSSSAPSEVELSPGQNATAVRTLAIQNSESLEFSRPEVMLVVRATSASTNSVPVGYVIRYWFNPPEAK